MNGTEFDLVVLVPCLDMKVVVEALLLRHQALGIRPIAPERRHVVPHVTGKDPGCLRDAQEMLRSYVSRADHALVMFDRSGCGEEERSREVLENKVAKNLERSGWQNRAAVVVLDPELEIWVWTPSPYVGRHLGWKSGTSRLRDWLKEQNLWSRGAPKPSDPKCAVRATLEKAGKRPSSEVLGSIARDASFKRCVDPAFLKFRTVLQSWFPRQ